MKGYQPQSIEESRAVSWLRACAARGAHTTIMRTDHEGYEGAGMTVPPWDCYGGIYDAARLAARWLASGCFYGAKHRGHAPYYICPLWEHAP